jgi:hypothetical protein
LTNSENEPLEGKTLNVYAYMVKEGKPVGPREVMRGANLSSPSVAYWHLQKLEACGFLKKNAYGEYIVAEKVSISGHLWIGKNLVPRLICYFLFFLGILGIEISIIIIQFFFQSNIPNIDMIYLIVTNGLAMALFLAEGLLLGRKSRSENSKCEKKGSKIKDMS